MTIHLGQLFAGEGHERSAGSHSAFGFVDAAVAERGGQRARRVQLCTAKPADPSCQWLLAWLGFARLDAVPWSCVPSNQSESTPLCSLSVARPSDFHVALRCAVLCALVLCARFVPRPSSRRSSAQASRLCSTPWPSAPTSSLSASPSTSGSALAAAKAAMAAMAAATKARVRSRCSSDTTATRRATRSSSRRASLACGVTSPRAHTQSQSQANRKSWRRDEGRAGTRRGLAARHPPASTPQQSKAQPFRFRGGAGAITLHPVEAAWRPNMLLPCRFTSVQSVSQSVPSYCTAVRPRYPCASPRKPGCGFVPGVRTLRHPDIRTAWNREPSLSVGVKLGTWGIVPGTSC